VDSFKVKDYEDYWQTKNEKHRSDNNPKNIHTFTFKQGQQRLSYLTAISVFMVDKGVIGFMKHK
jgi:hypothetical protein